MKRIDINGRKYDYPESFDDITMKQYVNCFYGLRDATGDDADIALTTIENEAIIISRLLGESDDFCYRIPLPVFRRLQEASAFIYQIKDFMDSKEFSIKIDGRKYFMPDVEEMSLRQFIDADMIMKEEGKDQFIELLACLLLPYREDGTFEYNGNYRELIPKIEQMRASDGLPFIYTYFKKKVLSKKVLEDFSQVREEAGRLLQSTQSS